MIQTDYISFELCLKASFKHLQTLLHGYTSSSGVCSLAHRVERRSCMNQWSSGKVTPPMALLPGPKMSTSSISCTSRVCANPQWRKNQNDAFQVKHLHKSTCFALCIFWEASWRLFLNIENHPFLQDDATAIAASLGCLGKRPVKPGWRS